ncbi:hypothetical protein DL771_001049 [Monosporascus sp. 5C6A]|nr:hypothetical protein DL771_001049 [Monosporascus sp. 5C6A]
MYRRVSHIQHQGSRSTSRSQEIQGLRVESYLTELHDQDGKKIGWIGHGLRKRLEDGGPSQKQTLIVPRKSKRHNKTYARLTSTRHRR